MHPIEEIIKYISKVKSHFLRWIVKLRKRDVYVKESSPNWPWVFVSYIPSAFYARKEQLDIHQNQREMLRIVDVITELGYNVYVMDYLSKRELPDIDVKVVFGIDPLFHTGCQKYTNAVMVYYATGAYFLHQNRMVIHLTNEFNMMFNSNIPYRRLVQPHDSCQIADKILLIGSGYTVETYPKEVLHKISIIHQSTQNSKTLDHVEVAKEREFVFMGSGGNALKGIGLLIRYFSVHTDYVLHIIGPMEDDLLRSIGKFTTSNIKFHGFLNVNGDKFLSIVKRCNFLIYPSGSEGCPGAVLNLMNNGVIPIVSRWASFDEISHYGYMLDSLSIDSIDMAVDWANSLTDDEILRMKKDVKYFTLKTYNIERYTIELRDFLCQTIANSGRSIVASC